MNVKTGGKKDLEQQLSPTPPYNSPFYLFIFWSLPSGLFYNCLFPPIKYSRGETRKAFAGFYLIMQNERRSCIIICSGGLTRRGTALSRPALFLNMYTSAQESTK